MTTHIKPTCFAVVTSITFFAGARVWIHSIHTCAMEGTRDSDTIVDIYKVIGKCKEIIHNSCIFVHIIASIFLCSYRPNDNEHSVNSWRLLHATTTYNKPTCFAVVTSITFFTGARVWIHSIHTCAMEGARDSDTIVDIYKVIGKWKGMIRYTCICVDTIASICLYM